MSETESPHGEWLVLDRELYDYATAHRPPRPFAFARQLWFDVRDPRRVGLWVVAAGLVAVGWWMRNVIPSAVALVPVGLFLHGLFRGAAARRSAPLKTGIVSGLKMDTLSSAVLDGEVNMGGLLVRVALPAGPLRPLIERKADLEVLFLHDIRPEGSPAVAVRVIKGVGLDFSERAPVSTRAMAAGEHRIRAQAGHVTRDEPRALPGPDEDRRPDGTGGEARPDVNAPSRP